MDREQIDFFKGLKNGLIICAVAWFIILVSISRCVGQTPGIILNVPIEPKVANPLDVRQKIPTLADTTLIDFVFVGALTYVTSLEKYYIRQPSGWTEFATGKIYRIQNTTLINTVVASVGDYIITDGYYTSGDGGGAMYKVESSGTANGIHIFANGSNKARLQRNADSGINLRQLGCSPSNTTDNGQRFQLGLDSFGYVYNFEAVSFGVKAVNNSDTSALIIRSGNRIVLGQQTEIALIGTWGKKLLSVAKHTAATAYTTDFVIDGGVWDRNGDVGFGSGSVGGATGDYCFLFYKVKNCVIKNLKIKRVPKFAISIADFENAKINNIIFDTDSDGIHFMGPGRHIDISYIYGVTGDDFVAGSGSDYLANSYSEGDITNINITNLYPHNSEGNIIALFPGNDGADNSYTFDNIYIQNIHGNTTNGSCINFTQYNDPGTVLDEVDRGILKNAVIKDVYAVPGTGRSMIDIGVGYSENLLFENIFAQDSLSKIEFSGFFTPDAWSKNVTFKNVYMLHDYQTRPITINNSISVSNINFENVNIKCGSNNSWIHFAGATVPISNVNIVNSKFYKKPGINPFLYIGSPNHNVTISNTLFDTTYIAVDCRVAGTTVTLNNVTFNSTIGVASNDTPADVKVVANSYQHSGSYLNTFRKLYGSIQIIDAAHHRELYHRISASESLAQYYPTGTRFVYRNIHASSTITITASGGETIDGAGSINLVAGKEVTFRKISDTAWETNLPSGGGLSSTATTNYLPKVNGSGVLVNSNIQDNGSTISIGYLSAVETWFRSSGNISLGGWSPNATDKLLTDGNIYIDGLDKGLIVDGSANARFGLMKYTAMAPVVSAGSGSTIQFGHVSGTDVRVGTGFTSKFELTPNGLRLNYPLISLSTNLTWVGNAATGNDAGSNNITFGENSLGSNTSGTFNVSLGRNANNNITSGDYNISIGLGSAPSSATDDHKLSIGNKGVIGTNLIEGDMSTSELSIIGKLKYNTSSSANASGLVGYATDGYMKNTTIGTGLSLSTAGVLSSTAGSTYWLPMSSSRIYYNNKVAITGDTSSIGSAYSLIVTPVTGVTDSTARIQIYNGSAGSKKRSELYINGGTSSSLRLTKYGTSESATLFGLNLSTSSVIQGDRHTYINNTGGNNYDLKIGANSIERMTIKGDSGIYLVNLPTGTADSTLAITADNRVIRIANASGGGGSADLTFSGASSPVTLASSSGTDVTLTAGTNVTFSQASNNLTINATGGSGITSLGGQTGSTQTFAYGQSGSTPSWSSASDVHTFRLPTGTNGQALKHNGTDWVAGTDANDAVGGSTGEVLWNNAGTEDGAEKAVIDDNTIKLLTGATVTGDSLGLHLHTKQNAGKGEYLVYTNKDNETELESSWFQKDVFIIQGTPPNSWIGIRTGGTAVGTIGSSSTVSTATIVQRQSRVEFTATSNAAAVSGYRSNTPQVILSSDDDYGGLVYRTIFGFRNGLAVSSRRSFTGLFADVTSVTDFDISGAGLINAIGLMFDSNSANWQFIHNDGSGTPTKVDVGFAKPSSNDVDLILFEMYQKAGNAGAVTFKYTNLANGDTFTSTATTNLPAAGTALAFRGWQGAGGSATATNYAHVKMRCESKIY